MIGFNVCDVGCDLCDVRLDVDAVGLCECAPVLFIFSFIIILFLFLFDECGICGECKLFACGVGLGVYLYML